MGTPNFSASLKTPFLNSLTWPVRVREPSANAIMLVPESSAALVRSVMISRLSRVGASGTATFPNQPIIQP
jgi:hypothetical protein